MSTDPATTLSLSALLQAHYPQLKLLHMGLAAASVSLFLLRALAAQAGQAWPLRPGARRLSMAVDSALLAAGASLWWLLGLNPLQQPWLALKLSLLLAYIVIGTLAMKPGRPLAQRRLALLLALGLVAAIVGVARGHSSWPL